MTRAAHDELTAHLAAQGLSAPDADELLAELFHSRVIVAGDLPPEPVAEAPADFPLQPSS